MELSRRSLIVGGVGALGVATTVGSAGAADAVTLPTLRYGSSGANVTLLQQRLSKAGYWCGTADGHFGQLTQQAVYAIQKAAGISRDGVVNATTWSKVNAGVRPSRKITSGNAIEIDKSRQLLKVIRNGALVMILNTSTGGGYRYTTKSGGTALAVTPSGSFKVWYTYNGMQHGSLGDLYRPRYFNRSIAVHGSGSIPPYPVSHGCCRVSNRAMDMIWARNYMPMGCRVLVY